MHDGLPLLSLSHTTMFFLIITLNFYSPHYAGYPQRRKSPSPTSAKMVAIQGDIEAAACTREPRDLDSDPATTSRCERGRQLHCEETL
jgi:hypothetical protein